MKQAEIFRLIELRREHQESKYGSYCISGDAISEERRAQIVRDEFFELMAEARKEGADKNVWTLIYELVDVAACAVGWLETIETPEDI